MIVVTGWPRSGTSLLMQLLAAGGLDPIVGPNAREPRAGNAGGTWETPIANRWPLRAVWARRDDPTAVIKIFFQPLEALARMGVTPAGIVLTDRAPAAAAASQHALEILRLPAGELEAIRARALEALAGTPRHVIPLEELVGSPARAVAELAAFVEPLSGVELDRDAMAAIPDPDLLHF